VIVSNPIEPREKFWCTDPPALYEDPEQNIAFLLVFTTRRHLLDYYAKIEGAGKMTRNTAIQKRWARLTFYVRELGLDGINIDPDPDGGPSKLVLFNAAKQQDAPNTINTMSELEDLIRKKVVNEPLTLKPSVG
jgi:hypothetical protein